MVDYTPIDNERIEDILISLQKKPEEGHKKLDELVYDELIPGKNKEQLNLIFPTDEQKIISMALSFCIDKYGYDRRDIGNNLASKHPIDVARILIKYDLGNNIDYLDVCAALLHDIVEDNFITEPKIREHFIDYIKKSDIEEKEKYTKKVNKIIMLIENVTKKERDYNAFLGRVFKNVKAAKIKLADRIAQSFEMDERQYYGVKDKLLDYLRHRLLAKVGKERIEKGAATLKLDLKQKLSSPGNLIDGILYRAYRSLGTLKFSGDFFLKSIYKDFRNIDNACNYINNNAYDPTMGELKDMLIYSSRVRLIEHRMEHLKNGKHVSQEEIKYAKDKAEESKKSGELYQLTGFKKPLKETDIILPFYNPAMQGKDFLKKLNDFGDKQYLHLAMWDKLFERYDRDVIEEKHTGLFTFKWGLQ